MIRLWNLQSLEQQRRRDNEQPRVENRGGGDTFVYFGKRQGEPMLMARRTCIPYSL